MAQVLGHLLCKREALNSNSSPHNSNNNNNLHPTFAPPEMEQKILATLYSLSACFS
jgi:hypothetical protein